MNYIKQKMVCCQIYVNEWVTRQGRHVYPHVYVYTGSEFSEKVVRTTLTNKTVSWWSNVILFSDESIEARFGPALAHEFSQKAAWAPTFSTRNIFITISWDFPIAVNGIEQRYF